MGPWNESNVRPIKQWVYLLLRQFLIYSVFLVHLFGFFIHLINL